MASISTYLQQILDAVYGEEVRGSIHNAISAMNDESSSAMEYAKNAKDSAANSATNAANSATAAKTSETNAANSVTAAKTSETNAANSVTAAKTSETNAANSAIAAEMSEASAANSATNAANSATAAKTSETNAADSAAAAKTSETNAANSATAAKTSETNAAASATNAANSATIAQQYSGNPPQPKDGTWWIWNADAGIYEDTGISCELTGPTGNGIESIVLTSGDHTAGSTDIYTITMTDGTKTTISVYNGKNGTGTGDVMGISFDFTVAASEWSNGSVAVSDSRFIASSQYRYFIDAYDDYRETVSKCSIMTYDITSTGYLTLTCETAPTVEITFTVLRVEVASSD